MPGEFKTLVRPPHEGMKEFNERLREACQSAPITSFKAVVVDGQPVITLISEVEEATDEDVANYKENGETLTKGELIPIDDTLLIQISGMSSAGDKAAGTEHAHDVLNRRADGECVDVEYFTGQFLRWEPDYNDVIAQVAKPKHILVQGPVTFAAIVSLQEPVGAEPETAGKK